MPKRGENIYKRRDGRWEGRFICARKPNGQAVYRSIYGKTYAEVKNQLNLKRQQSVSLALQSCDMTVKDLMTAWITANAHSIKESSYTRYALLVEKHILPQLGELAVQKLTAETLQAFLDQKLISGRLDGTGGLSIKTVNDIYVIIKSALKRANRFNNFAVEQVFAEVKAPQVKQPKISVFGPQTSAMMVHNIYENPDISKVSYLLCMETGIRLGELCGLRWSDIDFREGILKIRRTVLRLNFDGRTKLAVQTPKSVCSEREIPLTVEMLSRLKSVRGNISEDAFILTGLNTRPMEPRTMQYRFYSFQKKLGLRPQGFHTLRHTFATRCVECGMDAKSLSELLGHSNIKTTLQMYVHPSMEQKRQYLEKSSCSYFRPSCA